MVATAESLRVREWEELDNVTILGLQWGDEGKGKLLDALAKGARVFVRFNGGGNTGHTVKILYAGQTEPVTFKFHYLPSGVGIPDTVSVIANGVLVDMIGLVNEIDTSQGILDGTLGDEAHRILDQLKISSHAHLVLPYHKLIDAAREAVKARTGSEIGTTKTGCGPCIEDKVARVGLRVIDLFYPEEFRRKFLENWEQKELYLRHVLRVDVQSADYEKYRFDPEIYLDSLFVAFERVKKLVCDTRVYVRDRISAGDKVMFEGAQAIHLDIDLGTYPFVTSGNTGVAGLLSGTGLGPEVMGKKIGVVKAYTTRVGKGPFPTEDEGDDGNELRRVGNEFGTTTGRPRRCGWLDLVLLKYSLEANGFSAKSGDGIGLTKLDVLTGRKKIKVCVGYKLSDGQTVVDLPDDPKKFETAIPVYEELDGWTEDITGAKTFEELPENAQKYVRFIEEKLGIPVKVVSVGPEREQTIEIQK